SMEEGQPLIKILLRFYRVRPDFAPVGPESFKERLCGNSAHACHQHSPDGNASKQGGKRYSSAGVQHSRKLFANLAKANPGARWRNRFGFANVPSFGAKQLRPRFP